MKMTYFSKIKKWATGFLVGIFAFVGLFGIYACVGFAMNMPAENHSYHTAHEHTSSVSLDSLCILGMQNRCGFNIVDHFEHWQSTFVFSLVSEVFEILTYAFIVFFISAVFSKKRIQQALQSLGLERYKLYKVAHREFSLYNFLTQFFASGILHPKIYA